YGRAGAGSRWYRSGRHRRSRYREIRRNKICRNGLIGVQRQTAFCCARTSSAPPARKTRVGGGIGSRREDNGSSRSKRSNALICRTIDARRVTYYFSGAIARKLNGELRISVETERHLLIRIHGQSAGSRTGALLAPAREI